MPYCLAVSSGSRLTPCGLSLKGAESKRMGTFRSCAHRFQIRCFHLRAGITVPNQSEALMGTGARWIFVTSCVSLFVSLTRAESLSLPCPDSRPSCAQRPSETLATPCGTRASPITASRTRTCSARPSGASRALPAHSHNSPKSIQ